MAPQVDEKYREEIEKARTELKILATSKEKAPYLLRLAYASQFSIANSHEDVAAGTKTTQSEDTNNTPNAIKKIKDDHPTITYPDLYQLAGVVAIEALEGPTIVFVPGRKDSLIPPDESCLPDVKQKKIKEDHPTITYPDLYQGPKVVAAKVVAAEAFESAKIEVVPGRKDSLIPPDESCFPDVKQSASDLRSVFDKVGISETKHIVALCGGLKLARSGIQAPTLKFDNSYFVELNKKKDSSPTDKALLDDQEFRDCVQRYATNKDAFIKDYKEAHEKLSELGLPDPSFVRAALEKSTSLVNTTVTTQRAIVGVAVAAAVVILGVFYLINRRRAKHSSPQF